MLLFYKIYGPACGPRVGLNLELDVRWICVFGCVTRLYSDLIEMMFNINDHYDDLLFVPLGGTDRIGMNFYAYHYHGKWLIIDMGLGYMGLGCVGNNVLGIEVTLPLPTFMEQCKDDVVGLILTHAHEDHIGAVPYLWDRIGCKIYAGKFTSTVLKAKLAEFERDKEAVIIEMEQGAEIKLEDFTIELVRITHSIPEMDAVLIKTARGNVLHTGDWKFDDEPVLGSGSDITKLKAIGDSGLLGLVCDSTNIFNNNKSGSEGELGRNLIDIVCNKCSRDGMVIVTTFASNIVRIHSIMKAAEAAGRKVVLAGRSLWRLYGAARDCGYLCDMDECIPVDEIRNFKKSEVLVICTGCQGESLAVSSKIANGTHSDISVTKGDSIIFSSCIIPGNERRIFDMLNRFCKLGVEVITERNDHVHVSGHPSRPELAELYELTRPQIAIPMHGEPIYLHEHCKFARAHGVKHTIEANTGDVLLLSENGVAKIGSVEVGTLVVDGNIIVDERSSIINERRVMSGNGVVVVLLLVNQRGRLVRQPKIFAPGVLDYQEDMELLDMLIEEVRDAFSEESRSSRSGNDKAIKKALGIGIKKLMRRFRKKEPYVLVHIEQVML